MTKVVTPDFDIIIGGKVVIVEVLTPRYAFDDAERDLNMVETLNTNGSPLITTLKGLMVR